MDRFSDRVTYEMHGRVACLTLDRPQKMNAFDADMYTGINEGLVAFRDDPEAWVLIIQANGGRAFSVGADMNALNQNAEKGILTSLGGLLLDDGMVTNKPIIAAVEGHCVGEGVNLALCCDLIIADPNSNFMISEAKVGTNAVAIPGKLAKKIGYSKAFAMLTPGDGKDALWCQNAGLVEEISAPGKVKAEAMALAERICSESGPLAIRAQKETLWHSVFVDEAEAIEIGQAHRHNIRQSDDYTEGRRAFLEKRKPDYKAR